MSVSPEQVIGSYRIVRKLGEGGMGCVFEAEHLNIPRRVAIKILRASYSQDPELLARFYNEARAASLIDHPSVVQVVDFGRQDDGSSYLVMELLRGETLRSRIARGPTGIGTAEALRIARQIASTLAAAHSCGIVHRDLKPENIMLVPDPEATDGQRIKILDFGIAKLAHWAGGGDVRTQTNVIVGTPAYMAPEQCRGAGQVDERADVYSLGIVLFEMLVGQRPFSGVTVGECVGQHLFVSPPRLDELLPALPPALVQLVAALLIKDRDSRPNMAQTLAELEALAGGRSSAPFLMELRESGRQLSAAIDRGATLQLWAVASVERSGPSRGDTPLLPGTSSQPAARLRRFLPRHWIVGGSSLLSLLAGTWLLLLAQSPMPEPLSSVRIAPPLPPAELPKSAQSTPDAAGRGMRDARSEGRAEGASQLQDSAAREPAARDSPPRVLALSDVAPRERKSERSSAGAKSKARPEAARHPSPPARGASRAHGKTGHKQDEILED